MRRHRLKLAIALVVLIALGLLLWRPVLQAWRLAALQASLGAGGEVSFDQHKPLRFLPKFAESWTRFLRVRMKHSVAADNRFQCFRSLFDGPMEQLLMRVNEVNDDTVTNLGHFPQAKRITASFGDRVTEEGVMKLCTGLRALPRLEHIQFYGKKAITDKSIAPLAGHPQIRSIYFLDNSLTPQCTATFATLPHLSELYIFLSYDMPQEDRRAMMAALPSTRIEFKGH